MLCVQKSPQESDSEKIVNLSTFAGVMIKSQMYCFFTHSVVILIVKRLFIFFTTGKMKQLVESLCPFCFYSIF